MAEHPRAVWIFLYRTVPCHLGCILRNNKQNIKLNYTEGNFMAWEVFLFKMATNRNLGFISQTSAKPVLHIFQDLNKHPLRFHALVWLHKQLSGTTSFCLPLVDRRYSVKELRILFQLEICPSVQAHHIIQLSVRFWMQRIQITCYRIQRRGGTERVRCGARVQGQSPMSARLRVNHNHFKWAEPCPTPAVVQKTQTLNLNQLCSK